MFNKYGNKSNLKVFYLIYLFLFYYFATHNELQAE